MQLMGKSFPRRFWICRGTAALMSTLRCFPAGGVLPHPGRYPGRRFQNRGEHYAGRKGFGYRTVLAFREVPLRAGTTAEELSSQLAHLGAQALMKVLPGYLDGSVIPQIQAETGLAMPERVRKADGLLDFSKSAEELMRMLYAYLPWPGTFLIWMEKDEGA